MEQGRKEIHAGYRRISGIRGGGKAPAEGSGEGESVKLAMKSEVLDKEGRYE